MTPSNALAVELEDVSKRFRRVRDRRTTLKERIVRGREQQVDEFWAVRDVSLQIPAGSVFGLAGHNGSGKSTVLKVIAGVYRPTHGSFRVRGRVAALIELGAGFHPDLSGRENIRLNGSILGLDRRTVASATDEIIEFSGIGDFIDEPVKTYSSGMYVRLGFSVAVHMRPDVLLVDEVLAVGDEDFQRRCLDHLHMLRRSGCTIVVVSHSLSLMESLCDDVAWLDHGRLQASGPASDVIGRYLAQVNAAEAARAVAQDDAPATVPDSGQRVEGGPVRLTRLALIDDHAAALRIAVAGEPMRLRVWWEALQRVEHPVLSLSMRWEGGATVGLSSAHAAEPIPALEGSGWLDVVVPGALNAGHYELGCTLSDGGHVLDRWAEAAEVVVRPGPGPAREGLVTLDAAFVVHRDEPVQPRPVG